MRLICYHPNLNKCKNERGKSWHPSKWRLSSQKKVPTKRGWGIIMDNPPLDWMKKQKMKPRYLQDNPFKTLATIFSDDDNHTSSLPKFCRRRDYSLFSVCTLLDLLRSRFTSLATNNHHTSPTPPCVPTTFPCVVTNLSKFPLFIFFFSFLFFLPRT